MHSYVDIAIIGAGAVGMAIAYELSQNSEKSIVVLEKNKSFGQETSSRNSEVIHSGLYYPADLLKTRLCTEGNQLLYQFCNDHQVACKRLGKLIIANDDAESAELERLRQNAKENQVNVQALDRRQIGHLEPDIKAAEALFFPDTGVFDSHGFMQQLYFRSKANEVIYLFDSEVIKIEYKKPGYMLYTHREAILSEIVINAAGLNSDQIAGMAGLDIDQNNFRLNPCKGEYYRLKNRWHINHLIYPLPSEGVLGIHITPDIQGNLRLGPNAYYVKEIDYSMDERHKEEFFASVARFIPAISREDLMPDCTGIRPKLQKSGEPVRDFVIQEESSQGLPALVNLIGIESPGLTSSLAIARYVKQIINEIT